MNRKLTFKDYMKIFDCSSATAKREIAKDRKLLQQKRLTAKHIMPRYGLDMLDLAPILL